MERNKIRRKKKIRKQRRQTDLKNYYTHNLRHNIHNTTTTIHMTMTTTTSNAERWRMNANAAQRSEWMWSGWLALALAS